MAAKKDTAPKPTLSLESLEKESTKEPFYVGLSNGDYVELRDHQDLDYATLIGAGNPVEIFEAVMSEEDFDKLVVQEGLKAWQFRQIFTAWAEHFGLGTPGESNA